MLYVLNHETLGIMVVQLEVSYRRMTLRAMLYCITMFTTLPWLIGHGLFIAQVPNGAKGIWPLCAIPVLQG